MRSLFIGNISSIYEAITKAPMAIAYNFNRSGMWVKHIIHMQTITLIPIVMYCKLLVTIIELFPGSEFFIGVMPSVNPFQYISLLFKK